MKVKFLRNNKTKKKYNRLSLVIAWKRKSLKGEKASLKIVNTFLKLENFKLQYKKKQTLSQYMKYIA